MKSILIFGLNELCGKGFWLSTVACSVLNKAVSILDEGVDCERAGHNIALLSHATREACSIRKCPVHFGKLVFLFVSYFEDS